MKKLNKNWILLIGILIAPAIIFALLTILIRPNYSPNKTNDFYGEKLDKINRLAYFNEYNFERLKNPSTGEIPPGIQTQILDFVSKIPSRDEFINNSERNVFNKIDAKPGTLVWQNIGPNNVGGRMNCISYDKYNPNILIAGAASGGIWKSTDSGISWTKRFPPNDNHTIYCLTQDTRQGKSNIWYAGSGELLSTVDRKVNTLARMSYFGDGIYKSTDNGDTWQLLPSTQTPDIGKFTSKFQGVWNIVVDQFEKEKDVVYAACIGSILKSTDGGNTWKQVLGDNNNIAFSTDLISAADGKLYAAFSRISLNGDKPKTTGIYVSSDKGEKWENITPIGFPDTNKVIKLASAPSNSNILYVFVDQPISGIDPYSFPNSRLHLWKCEFKNSKPNWTNLTASLSPKSKEIMAPATLGGFAMCIAVKPDDPNFVLLGGTSLYRSIDGFANNLNVSMIGGYYWDEGIQTFNYQLSSQYLHPDIHGFAFHPNNPNAVLVASDGGIHFSEDIKFIEPSWQSRSFGLITSQFYSVAVGKKDYRNVVLGGLQDNGSFYTQEQGKKLHWKELTGADGMHTYINSNYNYVLTSWYNGATVYIKFDPSTLNPVNSWFIRPSKASSSKFAFYNTFVVDPNNPNTIYLPALNSIYYHHQLMLCETDIQAFQNQWNINPPAPFVFAQNEVVTALEMPEKQNNTLYVGTRLGKIYRIKDANKGSNAIREEITGVNFPKLAWVSSIDYDETNNILLASFSNYGIVSIFASKDEGKSWQSIAGNLEENPDGSGAGPSVRWIKSVRVDNNETYYFAASDAGLFSTNLLDGNKTIWYQEGKSTIGNVICEFIDAVDYDKVVVATQGNGVWVSDLSKLSVQNQIRNIELEAFPNPASNILNIRFNHFMDNDFYVSIYNNGGQLQYISHHDISSMKNNMLPLDISNLKTGSYFIVIKSNKILKTIKFIKI